MSVSSVRWHIAAMAAVVLAGASGLGADPQPAGPRTITFSIQTPESAVTLVEVPRPEQGPLIDVQLAAAEPTARAAEPGRPALPYYTRAVAVPHGAQIQELAVVVRQTDQRPLAGPLVWAQLPRPGSEPPDEPAPPEPGLYYPADGGVDPDTSILQTPAWPADLVRVTGRHTVAGHDVLTLAVTPVQWRPGARRLDVHTDLQVTLTLNGGTTTVPASYGDAMNVEKARDVVVNAGHLPSSDFPIAPRALDAWYLIVTDNHAWRSDGHRGAPLDGDVVAQFERLAKWKTEKGVKARVVTISDIVDGVYGDFRSGAADLPETLRRFLKHAADRFGTYWVLLGGDVEVVPPRYVTATYAGTCGKEPRPGPDGCFYDAATKTLRVHGGPYRGTVSPSTVIFTSRNATGFRRVSAPSETNPGWAYVTGDDYAVEFPMQTDFVVVRGAPTDLADASVYLDDDWHNMIPTDLYYASLDDGKLPAGRRPWDGNGNGVYGQFNESGSLDAVAYWPDLTLGRAPVSTEAEAQAFVDKVIAYEKYDVSDFNFWRRALFAAGTWWRQPEARPGAKNPPETNTYFHGPGALTARVHFLGAPVMPSRLYAWRAPGDWTEVPYSTASTPGLLSYRFNTNDTYATTSLDAYGGPKPEPFVTMDGSSSFFDGAPVLFFKHINPDESLLGQEKIKAQLAAAFPGLDLRLRLYEDLLDAPDYPSPDLYPLTEAAVRSALETGYNVVSLSGHGNSWGCCGLSGGWARSLTNGMAGGVGYADSCLTNQFDADDAVGEMLVTSVTGGLVAYVGNSRYGWQGTGNELEQRFWARLETDRRLGWLHDSKALLSADTAQQWTNLSLTLNGDPEMSLWVTRPRALTATHPERAIEGRPFAVRVTDVDGAPVAQARVAVSGPGDVLWLADTGQAGEVEILVANVPVGSPLVVTVTKTDHIPTQHRVEVAPADPQ